MGELREWIVRKASELPEDWVGSLGWLSGLLGGNRPRLAMLSLLRCAAVLVGVASAAVNRHVLDAAVARSAGLAEAIALVVLVQGTSVAISMALSWVATTLGERMANDLRLSVYDRLLGARWEDFSRHHSEQLLSRLTSDVSNITNGLTGTAVSLLAMVVQAVAAYWLLWRYDVVLAVFIAVLMPVALLASVLVSLRLRVLQQRVQQAEADYRQRAQEVLSHEAVIKAFEAREDELARLSRLQGEHERLVRRRARLSVVANLVMGATFTGSYLFAFVHGVLGIADGAVSYGTFVAFLSLVSQVQSSLSGLGGMLPRAASVVASVARVREVADLPQDDPEGGRPLLNQSGGSDPEGDRPLLDQPVGVRAEGLAFTYGTGREVLRDVSFRIAPGEVVAVMGPSGAGKTTLVRLLLGLVDPTEGSIGLTCGEDRPGGLGQPSDQSAPGDGARVVPCRDARSLVSYVPQGNTLLSGTIRENLLMGGAEATDDQLRSALAAADALCFVEGLPGGLDARVGERAGGISEGQAQRIAIARALVRPAGLLLLDEATSALDEDTELAVMRALRDRSPRPTCVVVTHRRSVVSFCDRVLLLREGRLVEDLT